MEKSLFDQMSFETRDAVACILGFDYSENGKSGAGFRVWLQQMKPFANDEFTVGDVVRAYCAHVQQSIRG